MQTFLSFVHIFLILFVSIDCEGCPKSDGYFQDPSNCSNYFNCSNGRILKKFSCPQGTVFDPNLLNCVKNGNTNCIADSKSLTKRELKETPAIDLNNEYKIVCCYSNWAYSRPDGGSFTPQDIDPQLCTHINYDYVVLNKSSLTLTFKDQWGDVSKGYMKQVVDLKKKNPKLKVLLSLGGWTDSDKADDKYGRLVKSKLSRQNFIKHSIEFLTQYQFDGLDISWKYPLCWQADCSKGDPLEKSNFAIFVSELRKAYKPKGWLLTANVSPSKTIIDDAYDAVSLAKDLDFINVNTWDLHGVWESYAAHQAPLKPRRESYPFDSGFITLTVYYAINHWISIGMPNEKIVVGLPFFGVSYTLKSPAASHPFKGFGATKIKAGDAGPFTGSAGLLAYYEICENIKSKGWIKAIDPPSGLPFAFKDNQWACYDDIKLIKEKCEYIKKLGLGGAIVWTLDFDDFKGRCCKTKWPLLKTVNAELRRMDSLKDIEC